MTQAELDEWNKTFPPGSPCILRKDNGTEIETRTKSKAWIHDSGKQFVLVEDVYGPHLINHLKMLETHIVDSAKNDGGTAASNPPESPKFWSTPTWGGVPWTLRAWFAGQALVGLCANPNLNEDEHETAQMAIAQADEMIRRLQS